MLWVDRRRESPFSGWALDMGLIISYNLTGVSRVNNNNNNNTRSEAVVDLLVGEDPAGDWPGQPMLASAFICFQWVALCTNNR